MEMKLVTNLNNTVSRGSHTSDMSHDQMIFFEDKPLLALYSTQNLTFFSSVGGIRVQNDCTKGMQVLVEQIELPEDEIEDDSGYWLMILVAALVVLAIIIIIGIVYVVYNS